jgi:molecular chaperone GrpE
MSDSPPFPEPADPLPAAEPSAEAVRLAEAEAEVERLKDQLLRALAEQENIRRRADRDKEDGRRYAATNFAKDLLSTADNLRRALETLREDQVKEEAVRNLLQGVAATERELMAAFQRHGIRRIEPAGEKFDHNLHQAIFEVESSGKPAGTVVQVLQPGYVLNDRLLRAAMVGVAKGPVAASAVEPQRSAEPAKPGDAPEGYHRIDTSA